MLRFSLSIGESLLHFGLWLKLAKDILVPVLESLQLFKLDVFQQLGLHQEPVGFHLDLRPQVGEGVSAVSN